MICVSCAGKLEPSMRHAMLSNLCPFCGQNIFTAAEADFRKSIFRILLKNGVENDDLIARLVDDISSALRKDISPVEAAALRRASIKTTATIPSGSQEAPATDEEMTVEADVDDSESELPIEARNAPSRILTAGDRARPVAPAVTTSSKVDMAMRAFDAIQKEDEESKSDSSADTGVDAGGDELEREFLKSAGVDPAEILHQRIAPGATRPGGFKNTPVRRAN